MSKSRIEEIKKRRGVGYCICPGSTCSGCEHLDDEFSFLLQEIDRLNGKVEKLEAVEIVYKDKIEETNSLELELQESTVKLQALEAENEYLKRQLADERSGDCDKDKTIRRLESNYNNIQSNLSELEEQAQALVEIAKRFAEVNDEKCRKDHHGYCQAHYLEENCMVSDLKQTLEEYEAWKRGQS